MSRAFTKAKQPSPAKGSSQPREDAMNSQILQQEKIAVDTTSEVSSFIARVGSAAGILIGVWAVTALVAALVQVGPLTMLRGYITAITGF
jgi:hypothetical protein